MDALLTVEEINPINRIVIDGGGDDDDDVFQLVVQGGFQ